MAAIRLLKRKPKLVIDRIKRIDRACDEKAHMSRKHNDKKKGGLHTHPLPLLQWINGTEREREAPGLV